MRKQQVLTFSVCGYVCASACACDGCWTAITATIFRVVAVSSKEFRYGLQADSGVKPPCHNIEQLKGTSATQWTMQCKGIQEQWVL